MKDHFLNRNTSTCLRFCNGTRGNNLNELSQDNLFNFKYATWKRFQIFENLLQGNIRLTFANFLILKKARSPNLLPVILPLLQLSFITSTFPFNLKLSNPNQSPPTIQTHLQPHLRILQATRDRSMQLVQNSYHTFRYHTTQPLYCNLLRTLRRFVSFYCIGFALAKKLESAFRKLPRNIHQILSNRDNTMNSEEESESSK